MVFRAVTLSRRAMVARDEGGRNGWLHVVAGEAPIQSDLKAPGLGDM